MAFLLKTDKASHKLKVKATNKQEIIFNTIYDMHD